MCASPQTSLVGIRPLVLAVFFAWGTLATSCRTPAPEGSAALDDQTGANLPLAHATINSQAHFEALSRESEGLIRGGRLVKFLVDNRTPAQAKVWFINGNFRSGQTTPDYAKYHYYFARHHLNITENLNDFNQQTYFTADKRYLAGTVHTYTMPDVQGTIYGVQFYPQDVITGQKAIDAAVLIKKAIKIEGAKFAFVETGSQQKVAELLEQQEATGLLGLSIEKILGATKYIAMHRGEAWGYLRIFPQNQDHLTATDIPVFDELPLDLTVVAGTVTRAWQDANSHVNLKSKERNTPNAVLRDAGPEHPLLQQWADQPVHLTVTDVELKIEATTPEIIEAKLRERLAKPWRTISWGKTSKILSYDAMCKTRARDCIAQGKYFGSKSANIGFLAHRSVLGRKDVTGTLSQRLGYDLVPRGFGIPLRFYKDLVDHPANAALKAKISAFITQEKAGTLSNAVRLEKLAEIQGLFFKATIPPQNLAAVRQALTQILPGIQRIKVRSSANAEDIEGFDGAGLHDSYSARLNEADNADGSCIREVESGDGPETKARMRPRTLACAMKGVYASLWNKRAVEERSFARLDHASVSMGIGVLPVYDTEAEVDANSVVVTRVINASDVYGYTLSVQRKNNLVTNPDPGTWSEISIAAFATPTEKPTFTVTRFAKPKADREPRTEPVLTSEQMQTMVEIARKVETAWCREKQGYYNGDCRYVTSDGQKPTALDLEFKFLENGQYVAKQVREFAGK